MSFPVAELDNLDFAGLMEQARVLIPRYAPEWTDHNTHDPGITLLELLAWLADQQIYQAGLVSDEHIAAFAGLLGVKAQGIKPAQGLIYLNSIGFALRLPQQRTVNCLDADTMPFELATDVYVSTASVLNWTGDASQCVIRFDQPLVSDRESEAQPISLGIVPEQSVLLPDEHLIRHGYLTVDYQCDHGWQRLEVLQDSTQMLHRHGLLLLNIPPAELATTPCQLRLTRHQSIQPIPPRIQHCHLNALPLIQQQTQAPQSLGKSTGLPDQAFALSLEGMLAAEHLTLTINQSGLLENWIRVADFSQSLPQDKHWVLDNNTGNLIFGNGLNGAIPPADALVNISEYALTQGSAGNVGAGLRWRISGLPESKGHHAENTVAFSGGATPWDIDQVWGAARQRTRQRKALLIDEELHDFVRELSGFGVSRVQVMNGFHPAVPDEKVPGVRTAVVIPEELHSGDRSWQQRYRSALLEYLAERQLLGEKLEVVLVAELPFALNLRVLLEEGVRDSEMNDAITSTLSARFTAQPSPEQQEIKPWPLGRPVSGIEISALLSGLGGISAVLSCELPGAEAASGCLKPAAHEVAVFDPTQFNVDWVYAGESVL